MEVLIRDMTECDVPYVALIEKLCFSLPWSEESFKSETKNKLARYFVAEHSGRVVGYVGMWHVLDEGHITNVAVHPDFRRQKIGYKLIDSLMDYAKGSNISFIVLEVRVGNISAQNLYRKFGFENSYIRKGYYTDNNEDAMIMIATLKKAGEISG